MNIGDRVRAARTERKLSQATVAQRAGVSQGLIAQIESGTNQGSKHIVQIADALNVSADWLVSGAGSQVIAWENERDMPPDDNRVWVDRWDYAFSAGDGGIQWEVRQKAALPFNAGFFAAIGSDAKDCRLLMVKGDSMEPFLFDRDMIMVDVTKTSIRDGRIYAVHFEGEAFIKQVFKQAAGALSLHSLNARYPDRLVELEDMGSLIIVGEVVYRSGSGFI